MRVLANKNILDAQDMQHHDDRLDRLKVQAMWWSGGYY